MKEKINYIIAGLLVIVLAGVAYLIFSNRGKETVEVVSFSPLNEVPQATNFTIEFSKNLVSDSLLNKQLDSGPIEFEPVIPGKFRWIETNKLRFYPDVLLAPSNEYTAEVSSSLTSDTQYALTGEKQFQFHTARFRVNSASVTFEFKPDIHDEVKLFSTIEFNHDVDPTEAVNYLSINDAGGGSVPFHLNTTTPSKIISLTADKVKRGDDEQEIHLQIKEGMPCIGGNLGLERDFVKQATVPGQQDLKVVRMMPRQERRRKSFIQIQFNIPVKTDNAAAAIQIEPPVNFKIAASHHYLELHGDFKKDTPYHVSIKKGLRAIDGSPLEADFSSVVSFRKEQIPPQIGFVGDGFFLTRNGNLNIGLSTINVNKVSIEVEKIYANNLVHLLNLGKLSGSNPYAPYYNLGAYGKKIYASELVIQKVENDEVVTPINVRDHLSDERLGIFKFTARMKDHRWQQSSKWVVATDLGIMSKKAGDDLWVWVNSLSNLTPISGADVKLISQNNQTLMSETTDGDGITIFENYTRFTDQFVPYLITVTLANDVSFLELHRRRIPTSDFDVGGLAHLQHGYQAFLYSERGVYRPGETANVAAIVRDENNTAPQPFPVKLQVKGPDGRILNEQRAALNSQAATEFSVAIPGYAKTGRYVALLQIGDKQEIGRTSFNVEEFVPDRMKVKLITEKNSFNAGETMTMKVEGITLFGPPAAGRRVVADIEIEPSRFSPQKWSSFSFVDNKKKFAKIKKNFGEKRLDEQGKFSFSYKIPTNLNPPSSLRGIISTTVLEPGGRGVSAYRAVQIHPYKSYVGLRKATEGYAALNEPTTVELIVVESNGEPIAGQNLEISFYRIYWQSILKRATSDGKYRYTSEKVEELVHKFSVTSEEKISRFNVTPEQYGRHRVVAQDLKSGASSSIAFYASGWGYAPWAMDHPDRIEIDVEKDSYGVSETATIQIRAPFSGKLFLTVERDKIFHYQILELQENSATIEIPVKEAYKPNVYVSAHLIRSTEGLDRDTPVRAFGVAPLMVNTEDNRLAIELDAPFEVRPNTPLDVNFQIQGDFSGKPYVTIAAVDEGICQLTDFQTPDPHSHFFSKKRLTVESFDIYGVVLPEISSTLSSVAGDVEAARKRQLTPVSVTRVKPVAFWSGLIETDRKGRGRVSFEMPQFNGSIRLMAVAFAGDKFGNAQKNVFVREPIVLTPTFPRFISSTDDFSIPVNIFNGTGKDATFVVKLEIDGPVKLITKNEQQIRIPEGSDRQVYFNAQADESTGEVQFRLTCSGGGERSNLSVDVPLRPPVPFITLAGNGTVEAGKPATFTFPSDWIEGTTNFKLTVSSFPAVKFSRSLQYLLTYPYGCIEQTTSKLFPLLAFNDIARVAEPELFETNSADYYLEEGITRLENMQLVSGAFSYWPSGGYINNWSSIYASHFLIEARKAGYVVSDRIYNRLINALQAFTRDYRNNDAYTFESAVYAAYVLALAGKTDKSTLLYFKNSALDKLRDYSKFQLAGAFALSGDLQTARELLPKSVVPIKTTKKRETGRNFNSSIRAQAIMLDVLAEVDAKHPMVPVLVENLSNAASKQGRWHTTQENAYAFLALGKILRQQGSQNYRGTVTIDTELSAEFDTENKTFSDDDWSGKKVSIEIDGTGTCYYYWRADGIPSKLNIEEFDHDLQVRRRYLDKNGNAIIGNQFQQGDMVIAEISVKALSEHLDNVAIVDMLPAGFEIENPRLQSRKGVAWIGRKAYQPMYMDIRDDRMIIFGNFRHGQTRKFYYGLRAVTAGNFILPPIRGEAMYAPSKASVASSGKVVIKSL